VATTTCGTKKRCIRCIDCDIRSLLIARWPLWKPASLTEFTEVITFMLSCGNVNELSKNFSNTWNSVDDLADLLLDDSWSIGPRVVNYYKLCIKKVLRTCSAACWCLINYEIDLLDMHLWLILDWEVRRILLSIGVGGHRCCTGSVDLWIVWRCSVWECWCTV